MRLYCDKVPKLFAKTTLGTSHPCDWWDSCGDDFPVLKKYAIRILSLPCSTSFCKQSLSSFESAQTEKREPSMPAVVDDYLHLRTNALLMQNFNTMKEKIRKTVDLEKLGELPDFTEFMNETKVPWSASARKDGESEKHFRLHFTTKLPLSLYDGNAVLGEKQTPILVILADSSTERVVQSGRLSELKLAVTVIEGDFDEKASKNWTRELFESNEIMGRHGNTPLLSGELTVTLKKGVGKLGAIFFNDVSSWTRNGKFRLGVKATSLLGEGVRVLEGISNAFAVEDYFL
ncbi:hypothetical protein EUGRSUZ_E02971 [Eucalyptus grandis]|uniref:Uncharacterized protein n=2 Tax=Eucalyptus grandis TaxID=71139 RepID=A0ACC3KX75_EUCGR|nr:hypothetical protein EUGRSUZ_E02971 [Eucalyptus grandis]